MFGDWDIVHPGIWNPMTSVEQSMMEFDHIRMFMAPDVVINGEFFKDPPLQATEQRREQLTGRELEAAPPQKKHDIIRKKDNQPTGDQHTFSCYSFSNSTVADAKAKWRARAFAMKTQRAASRSSTSDRRKAKAAVRLEIARAKKMKDISSIAVSPGPGS
ncbi:hypothetical protein GQ600_18495 [Phytophthora cactorum]|nr:hypothetical protein GQ600_18495 [Phytophthora cactorum]